MDDSNCKDVHQQNLMKHYLFSDQTSVFATLSRRVFAFHFSSNATESLCKRPIRIPSEDPTEETVARPDPLSRDAAQLSFDTYQLSLARSCQPFMPESRAGYTEPPTQSMNRNRHHLAQLCHSGSSTPRLNVGVFSKRKGVCYHRDGQVHSCRFCEILRTTAEPFLYQDEHVVVFRPLRPIVPSHVLIVPRAHIRNVNRLAAKHRGLLARMHHVAKTFMTRGSETKTEAECVGLQPQELKDFHGHRVHYTFHVPPFNSIDHVHMHAFLDDPCSLGCYGRLKYRTTSWWCRSYDQVMARLEKLAVDVQNECVHTDEESPSAAGPTFSLKQA